MLCLRFMPVPVSAQDLSYSFTSGVWISTGSIIWPMVPSANSMTGVRYLSARSKPLTVRSAISCTLAGASTIMWKSPWPMPRVAWK